MCSPTPSTYGTTPFTEGGVDLELISAAGPTGSRLLENAGYFLTLATMIQDGSLHEFTLWISETGDTPPVGVAYGVSFLDSLGNYQEGYAINIA